MDQTEAPTQGPYIVLRKFSAGGCDWKPGEVFDANKCSERMLRVLQEQRHIGRDGVPSGEMSRHRKRWLGINPDSSLSVKPSVEAARRAPKRRVKADSEWNGRPGHIYFKHTGKRRYRVFEGDLPISEAMKKEDAEAEASRIAEARRSGVSETPISGGE